MTADTHPALTIVGVPQSNFTRSVRMVCEEKGISYRLDPVVPQSPHAWDCHPLGLIPGLIHGEIVLSESLAIAAYLDARFGGSRLFPDDIVERASVAQWAALVSISIDRTMIRDYVFAHAFPKSVTGPDVETITAALPIMRQQMSILDAAVQATGFLVGPALTYADLALIPILAAVGRYPEGQAALEEAPALNAYLVTHSGRPSFKATQPHI